MKKILATFLSVLICFCSAFVAVNGEEEVKINLYFESQRITAEKSTVSLKIDLPENFDEAYSKYSSGEISIRKAADMCGMNYGTFYNRICEIV